jgi:hypothetical protein
MEVDSRPCCQRWVIARPITAWLRQLDPFRGFARMDLRTRRLAIASWENRTSGRAQGQPDKIATAGTARAPIASRERRLSTSVKREGVSSPNYLLRALGERRVSARQGGRVRRAIEATRLGAEVKLEGVSSEHLSLPSVFPP